MIVLDASAAIAGLIHRRQAWEAMSNRDLHAPHVLFLEVASGLRRLADSGTISAAEGWDSLERLRRMGITRHPEAGLLERVWDLRHNLTVYDAAYVSLAEALGCGLLTADGRMSRAPGVACAVTVVPA